MLAGLTFIMACLDGGNTSPIGQNSGTEAVTAGNQDLRDTPNESNAQDPQNATQESATVQGAPNTPENIPLTNNVTEQVVPTNRPTEPLGLKGVVYTDTEIELFWDRSEDPSVVSYHITRNGIDVTSVDALSYYDNGVQPGLTYEYTLQAVNADGVRSTSVSQFLTTPEKTPTINLTNADSILEHVTTVTSGIMFKNEMWRVDALGNNADSFNFSILPFESDDYVNRDYNCDINGQLMTVSDGFVLPSYDITLDNCASVHFDEETMNGEIIYNGRLSQLALNSGVHRHAFYDPVISTKQNGTRRELTGLYSYFEGRGAYWFFKPFESFMVDDQNNVVLDENGEAKKIHKPFIYTSAAFEGQTRVNIDDVSRNRGIIHNTTIRGDDWRHRLTADFTIQSPVTGNKNIAVTTPVEFFSDQEGGCFTTGQLKLSADDGSELLLDANTDSVDTYSLEIFADGIRTTNILPWSDHTKGLYLTPGAVSWLYRSALIESDVFESDVFESVTGPGMEPER